MNSAVKADDLTVREACQNDAKEIFELVHQAFVDYGKNGENPARKESLEEVCSDIEEHIVLVVETENQLIGSLRLKFDEEMNVYLKRFAIKPGFQGLGIGTRLFMQAEKRAIQEKARSIILHSSVENEKLVHFYKKIGFECLEFDTKNGYKRGLWAKDLGGIDE